jgi:hypothetical protein
MSENKPYIEREWQIHDASHFGEFGEDGPTICAMNDDGSCSPILYIAGPSDRAIREQIMQAVSALPDLLKACRTIMQLGKSRYHDLGIDKIVEAAIAKAEGVDNG